ncbi:MAG: glycerate kinase [Armatimonadota bacterium]|nr:glycerate kinase [Armatimonadota bacterium]
MKLILAPDSFKGSLTAAEAADAMASGIRQVFPDAEVVLLPLADGGEGTVEALVLATDGRRQTAVVTGPFGEPVEASFGLLGPHGETAVVEMAAAAGLLLVPPDGRDPRCTTTYGVGELLRQAVNTGAARIIVGLGGSATNDGGAGAMQALGVRFLDAAGTPLPTPITGRDLARLTQIDMASLMLPNVEIVIASDVTNPLLGPNGASAVYGPQKGADAAIVAELDAALANYAAVIQRDLGKDVTGLPGAGAAGGMGAGLMAFFDARMRSGIDLVLDTAGFNEKAAGADWLLTGEGQIDAQTLNGKAIMGVLTRCRPLGIPIIAFGGSVDDMAGDQLAAQGLRAAFPIVSGPMPLENAMHEGRRLLTQAVARVMRLL